MSVDTDNPLEKLNYRDTVVFSKDIFTADPFEPNEKIYKIQIIEEVF